MNLRKTIRDNIMIILGKINPEFSKRLIHKRYTGEDLDFKNPKTFDEKVNWLSLYGPIEKMAKCSDKIAVHDYLEKKNLGHLSNEILQVVDKPELINWDKLPNKFVIKTNNASRTNILVKDKTTIDKSAINNKLNKWLNSDYGSSNAEFHYNNIEPKILVEKFLEFKDNVTIDYKFFCFNGQPYFVYAIKDRDESGAYSTRLIYNLNWERIFIQKESYENDKNIDIDKPKYLNEMIEYSKILSEDFDFVRVDFYELEDKVVFGEMTFTPRGGNNDLFSNKVQKMLGDLIKINEI